MDDDRLEVLWAEREIGRVLLRYCRGVDRLDEATVRSCYHPDARDEHGSFEGDVDEFIAWAFRLLGRYTSTMHLLGNVLIDVHGDVAIAETYGIAYHRTTTEPFDPTRNLVIGVRYVDRFERRDGEWRIARRLGVTDWVRVDAHEHQWASPPGMRTGQRDRTDAIWTIAPDLVGPGA
jgi:hypothetical protein